MLHSFDASNRTWMYRENWRCQASRCKGFHLIGVKVLALKLLDPHVLGQHSQELFGGLHKAIV